MERKKLNVKSIHKMVVIVLVFGEVAVSKLLVVNFNFGEGLLLFLF